MVLTFTQSLAATEASPADVRAVLIGMLGCNLAWAIIDAAHVIDGRAWRSPIWHALQLWRSGKPKVLPPDAIVPDHLPPAVLPVLTPSDLARIRLHRGSPPRESHEVRLGQQDYLAALGVFLLVFLCLFPVAAPSLVVNDVTLALRLSNVVAVAMLFLTGFTYGRQVRRPWRTGCLMVAIGIVLVAIAMALGGSALS